MIDPKLTEDAKVPANGAVKFRSEAIKATWTNKAAGNVARVKKSIAAFERGRPALPPSMHAPLKKGQIGTIDNGDSSRPSWVTVLQVVDKNSAVVKLQVRERAKPESFDERTVWLSGVPTARMSPGSPFGLDPDLIWNVAGVKQFGTATGSRTVLVLKPLTNEEWQAFLDSIKK